MKKYTYLKKVVFVFSVVTVLAVSSSLMAQSEQALVQNENDSFASARELTNSQEVGIILTPFGNAAWQQGPITLKVGDELTVTGNVVLSGLDYNYDHIEAKLHNYYLWSNLKPESDMTQKGADFSFRFKARNVGEETITFDATWVKDGAKKIEQGICPIKVKIEK